MKALRLLCEGLLAVAMAVAGLQAENPVEKIALKLPKGMFSTQGNQIVDENRNPVRLSCVYWPGKNGKDGKLDNLDGPIKGIEANVNAIATAGFNCIRADINNVSLHDEGTQAFLAEMDEVVAAAAKAQMRIIIADHDNEGNFGSNVNYTDDCAAQQSNGIWYDLGGASDGTDGCKDPGHTTPESYERDWVSVAARYASNDTVIGYDLWNEPLATRVRSLWGGGSNHDIHQMYETVGSAMLEKDASKLIFAACPILYGPTILYDGSTNGSAPWGDCTGQKKLPVVFKVKGRAITDKVVYDVHLYANSIDDYAHLFNGSSSSPEIIKAMNDSFGFLERENIAPVWNGESGTGFRTNPDDQKWAEMLVKYMNGELGAQGGPVFSGNQQGMGIAWMAWCTPYNKDGDDNLGILSPDGTPIAEQMKIVKQLLYYPKGKVRLSDSQSLAARP